MRREARIGALGARQLRLITGAQLAAAGLRPSSVRSRVASGRLQRLHRGVFCLHGPPFSREQWWLAAVLACGPGSLLSDWPAAAHWRIIPSSLDPPLRAQVSAEGGGVRTRAGFVVHHRGAIDPRDRKHRAGIPLVSANLCLLQLAPQVDELTLEQMLVAADSLGLLNRRRLGELVQERAGRPGSAKLEALLAAGPRRVRSDLELLFEPVWRGAGLPRPLCEYPLRVPGREKPLLIDFAWPSLRMVVETDSQRFHGDWAAAEEDRDRDQLAALAGWISHRFVRRRVAQDPRGQAERLRALVEVRRAELG